MDCEHNRVRCLNHYDTFRKYLCEDCNQVLMCECEKELALTFLPHQTTHGTVYGTQERYEVNGFAEKMCSECRGNEEEANPRAAMRGQMGKIQRYYWREIYKTYLSMVLDYLGENEKSVKGIIEFERRFKATSKKLKKAARKIWQQEHKHNPKYDTTEITESAFLTKIAIPEVEIFSKYVQILKGKQKIGKWIGESGENVSVEQIAIEHYRKLGFNVFRCERKLISSLVGTFCFPVIQDPEDPENRISMRSSTKGWTSSNRNTPLIVFSLPRDLGSNEYYNRRKKEFNQLFSKLRKEKELQSVFQKYLEPSTSLRDYLWVNEDYSIELTKVALGVLPKEVILEFMEWTIEHFGKRQSGWPDLFLFKSNQYKFVEVKSPNDKLSLNQMQWFEWVIKKGIIPCEICRVKIMPTSV